MNTIALLIASLSTLVWYIIDSRKKLTKSPGFSEKKFTYTVNFINAKSDKYTYDDVENEKSAGHSKSPVGRLYYSIPGQTYRGFIWKGRILKTGIR
ncbi:hypothetical protein [Spirosoma pollinicola]|uniref:Uncharacterized protein n=1 Tax=Spirosoma pollinicola TaxID=2057025 RepID=A0A2K8YYP8_9BACT|nr:hypothetical protein [Spirosoma pollinicola]AUD02745.1 hypothetical protein CWM47_13420 [Spirosoma pollinicola]